MAIKDMNKQDLELLSNKDITNLLLEEKACQNTAELFSQIIELLDLPKSTFDNKIGDFFTSLTTDKRFILLEDGNWDLRSRHNASKIAKVVDEDDDDEDLEDVSLDEEDDITLEEDDFDVVSDDDEDTFDDDDDDLKDLVILDEDELELEQ